MKYLIVECHHAYAVALDEDGNFLKVANMQYSVGQTVAGIVPLNINTNKSQAHRIKWIYPIATAAACLVLLLIPALLHITTPAASVYMAINPQVRIDVNKNDIVMTLCAENDDGVTLLSDYNYKKKNLDLVLDELVDRAIEMEYLREGGKITLTLDSKNSDWVSERRESINTKLNRHLENKLKVDVEVTDKKPAEPTNTSSTPESSPEDVSNPKACTNPTCKIDNCDGEKCKTAEDDKTESSVVSNTTSSTESATASSNNSSTTEKVESTTSEKTESVTPSNPNSTTSDTTSTPSTSKPDQDNSSSSNDKENSGNDNSSNNSSSSDNSSTQDKVDNENKPNYKFPFDKFEEYFDKYFDFDYKVYYYSFED